MEFDISIKVASWNVQNIHDYVIGPSAVTSSSILPHSPEHPCWTSYSCADTLRRNSGHGQTRRQSRLGVPPYRPCHSSIPPIRNLENNSNYIQLELRYISETNMVIRRGRKTVAKGDYSPRHVSPSVRFEQRDSHRRDFRKVSYFGFILTSVDLFVFQL